MPQINDIVGEYELIKRIGGGSFGSVYLAEKQTRFKATFAIKIPHDQSVPHEKLMEEAETWRRASGHPNIVPVIDADIYNGTFAIVSEYVSGGSLRDKIGFRTGNGLPHDEARTLADGILAGIEHLHAARIVHRDLKPPNILMQHGTPRITDFGVSRVLTQSKGAASKQGTLLYMPPEAIRSNQMDKLSDIWAVGVILYELLTGNLPFDGDNDGAVTYAILNNPVPALPASLPPTLRAVVRKALEKDPKKRFQSADLMRSALKSAPDVLKPPLLTRVSQWRTVQRKQDAICEPDLSKVPLRLRLRTALAYRIRTLRKWKWPALSRSAQRTLAGRQSLNGDSKMPIRVRVRAALILRTHTIRRWKRPITAASIVSAGVLIALLVSNQHNRGISAEEHLADNLYVGKQFVQAEPLIRAAVRRHPESAAWTDKLGDDLFYQKRYTEAEPFFRAAVKLEPDSAWYQHDLGLDLVNQNRYQDAEPFYRAAVRLVPTSGHWQGDLGNDLLLQHRDIEAESFLRSALRLEPESIVYRNMLARCLNDRGNVTTKQTRRRTRKAAEPFYREAVALASGIAEYQHNLAANLYGQGRYGEAEPFYRTAVRIDARNVGYQHDLGRDLDSQGCVFDSQQEYRQAEPLFREAVRLWPDNSFFQWGYGNALYKQGRYREAEPVFREAIRLDPTDNGLQHDIGNSLYHQGRYADAEPFLRESVRLSPTNAQYQDDAGNSLYYQHKYADAEPFFREALRLDPSNSTYRTDVEAAVRNASSTMSVHR